MPPCDGSGSGSGSGSTSSPTPTADWHVYPTVTSDGTSTSNPFSGLFTPGAGQQVSFDQMAALVDAVFSGVPGDGGSSDLGSGGTPPPSGSNRASTNMECPTWEGVKAFGYSFFVSGPKNLLTGAGKMVKETVYAARDTIVIGVDAAATAFGRPLNVEAWSQAGLSNPIEGNPDFWKNTIINYARTGTAICTLGISEMALATYSYALSGDAKAFQEEMGGIAAVQ